MNNEDTTLEATEQQPELDNNAQTAENEANSQDINDANRTGQTHESENATHGTIDTNAEIQVWQDRYARMASEFENFKKRTNREKEQLTKFANEQMLKAFLPVIDDLERALVVAEQADNTTAIQDGIKLVHKNLKHALEKQGVITLESVGKDFDSEYHEALGVKAVEDPALKGKVVEEFERGYIFNDKVIRFAKVIIGE